MQCSVHKILLKHKLNLLFDKIILTTLQAVRHKFYKCIHEFRESSWNTMCETDITYIVERG
jgi:hypothetical protein